MTPNTILQQLLYLTRQMIGWRNLIRLAEDSLEKLVIKATDRFTHGLSLAHTSLLEDAARARRWLNRRHQALHNCVLQAKLLLLLLHWKAGISGILPMMPWFCVYQNIPSIDLQQLPATLDRQTECGEVLYVGDVIRSHLLEGDWTVRAVSDANWITVRQGDSGAMISMKDAVLITRHDAAPTLQDGTDRNPLEAVA